jgi:hypothetical protein
MANTHHTYRAGNSGETIQGHHLATLLAGYRHDGATVTRDPDGTWTVTLTDGTTRYYVPKR